MAFYLSTEMNVPSLQSKYLTRDASNFMLRQLQGVAGTSGFPSYCFRGDNKTGMYWFSQGVLGLSSLGWTMFTFTNKTLTFYDRNRRKLNLTFDELTEPSINVRIPTNSDSVLATTDLVNSSLYDNRSFIKTNGEATTISAGMVVKLDGDFNVLLASADSPSNFGIGIAAYDVNASQNVSIEHSGVKFLLDWTAVLGEELLVPNTRYYLSDVTPGMITSTPPTNAQLVGIAIYPDQLLIKL